jgi:hypothetical protein
LSGDPFLIDAVASGDPYLSFATRAGLAPEGATKSSHRAERDLCKACVLGTNYGMGARTLAWGSFACRWCAGVGSLVDLVHDWTFTRADLEHVLAKNTEREPRLAPAA